MRGRVVEDADELLACAGVSRAWRRAALDPGAWRRVQLAGKTVQPEVSDRNLVSVRSELTGKG